MKTPDRPAPGLRVHQPARGFRYGAEAFWLAGFTLETGPFRTALDLGTGSGIVALLLASRGVDAVGVDARSEWSALWERTLAESATPGAVRLELRDVADGVPGRFDRVVSNPPFFPAGSGPAATDPWRRAARTEGTADLAGFVAVARGAVEPGGRACFVVPVEREGEVREAARPWVAVRVIRVGRRRSLLELAEVGAEGTPQQVGERDAAVAAWYAAVREGGAPWPG